MIRVEVVRGIAGVEVLRPEWTELVSDCSDATPFQTWEWQSLWLRHYGPGKKALTLCVRDGGDLIGLAPFVVSANLWRVLRWSGGGPSDYLQPISRTGAESSVNAEILEFLNRSEGLDLIDLHQVRENQPLAIAGRPTQRIDQAACLVLDLPGKFDEYLKSLGKSLRYDVRKLGKELFDSGRAEVLQAREETVDQLFEIFLEQHRARWRSRKLPGAFVGRSLRFHREWVRTAFRQGWLRLKVLKVDGGPVGAIYAMQFNGTVYYYQAGFDPAHKALSPGTLLVAESIRAGIEDGMTQFDFMRGAEPYKRRWMPQHEYHNFRMIFSGHTRSGDLGIVWNDFANRLEMKLRAKLEGGGAS
jgi:CelD/BcsL family acetyltransferase involved in cellulose biosynthesis